VSKEFTTLRSSYGHDLVQALARFLCEERGGCWAKREKYWTRQALKVLAEIRA
jgi:hypothetical protein